ncbi:membrane protein insertion efficiency factor YidD [Acetobacter sacchari]|uniref:Putative membrane protein insertion efficiency factor n=1 Tax=Acetobacter sacchari TaxID=2661687 RepID=A0ABS3LR70_9PROT|nr:membrane protein insertion efficiency factor YidD [Acetobacter sacchari]MBO1358404.1 membrane protein insertion efficiency factor YidD [Acetobacter sacchari]
MLGRCACGALVGGMRLWQIVGRPVAGPNCRFHPSCSEYGVEAVQTHGALRGSWLAASRILRCNPWNPGGYDPVPLPRAIAGAVADIGSAQEASMQ